jgi:hypothetical protein
MRAVHAWGPHQGFPCSLLPGFLSNREPQPRSCFESGMFSREFCLIRMTFFVIWNFCREFLIRVSPSHSYNAVRTRMDEWMKFLKKCVYHAVIMLCFWCLVTGLMIQPQAQEYSRLFQLSLLKTAGGIYVWCDYGWWSFILGYNVSCSVKVMSSIIKLLMKLSDLRDSRLQVFVFS